ncbi:hypothetical protein [Paenibacillus sp. WC2504]|uniref:hypothetical protein n=1 Tax=Paenibacillus sp. WC2504 TaxID=3461403 RepID=UPI004045F60B
MIKTTIFFICKGKAKDVLALLPPLERTSAETLREMAKSHTGLKVTLKDLAQMLSGDAGASAQNIASGTGNRFEENHCVY